MMSSPPFCNPSTQGVGWHPLQPLARPDIAHTAALNAEGRRAAATHIQRDPVFWRCVIQPRVRRRSSRVPSDERSRLPWPRPGPRSCHRRASCGLRWVGGQSLPQGWRGRSPRLSGASVAVSSSRCGGRRYDLGGRVPHDLRGAVVPRRRLGWRSARGQHGAALRQGYSSGGFSS
jgi:hypothetical protein